MSETTIKKEKSILEDQLRATVYAVLYRVSKETTIDQGPAWEILVSYTNTSIHPRQKETHRDSS